MNNEIFVKTNLKEKFIFVKIKDVELVVREEDISVLQDLYKNIICKNVHDTFVNCQIIMFSKMS